MTEAAIKILQKNRDGYVLMVDNGLINIGHQRGHAKEALDETIALNNAIEKAVELTKNNEHETLIIVTSDHAQSLVFTGYAPRNSSILGIAQQSLDKINYTSLLYGTGGNVPFKIIENKVVRDTPINTEAFNYSQQALIMTDQAVNSGTDVLVYAKGRIKTT